MQCELCNGVGSIVWVRTADGTRIPEPIPDGAVAPGCDECPRCFGTGVDPSSPESE